MSIVIALGVTTPETSYSDMAAGSDPESVEASPAVNEKNLNTHSCGSAQSHGYRGLPYTDHNYGAPPPPTPPASPPSQTIIPRMELNGVVRSSLYPKSTEEHSADSESSSEEDGSPWCHCSLSPDGLLVKCDNCRELDRRKGAEGLHRKTENVSVGESSATESGDEEVSPSAVSYTATQHTPTSIKLTVNRVKRSKSKKRKKSAEKSRGTPKEKKVKAFREGSRKSMRMKNSTSEASGVDENTAEGWENRIRQWTDHYEEALANQYSADIQTLLRLYRAASSTTESGATTPPSSTELHVAMDTINRTELACNNTVLGSQMQLQLGRVTRVQRHRKILRAAKNLDPDTLIIEYRGKVMLKQQFEVNGHFFKKPYPFVLFYSKFNEVEMCVDARTFGNDARFIRRSCTPNAEVRHMISDGMIHLCIYAISHISKDSEVTIGFDYEFNSCDYKVDCACHKGNQNCPVQKHNLSPRDGLMVSPNLPPPSALVGAETRRRKARRKELEGCVASDANNTASQQLEAKDHLGSSDAEEKLLDETKLEDGEEGEVDEDGVNLSNKKTFNNRRKRGGVEVKPEGVETENGAGNPSGGSTAPLNVGVGITTRRTTYITEPPPVEEKSCLPNPPAPVVPPKPTRPTKPRPKSRISRYRSSSSQRARRQRQALAQQQAAAAAALAQAASVQAAALSEEGSQGSHSAEHGHGDCSVVGHHPDGDGQTLNSLNRGNLRHPKTKKYLVTEWLNDKIPGGDKVQHEVSAERPLKITTDPTVLATTLNMLPGLSHTSLICTAPRHYVRFGSPFNPERRRPRPLQLDGTYGCYKKRWIKQVEDESCSASLEDGTESTSSQQSTSSRSTPNPHCAEVSAPIKKRRHKYISERTAEPSDHLLQPLSPITPPLPGDSPHPLLHTPCGTLLSNGLVFSPMPSLPTSRCNTPLQFENISSPEASPVHRPESVSPQLFQADSDASRPQFPDLSLPSTLESPVATTSEDFSFPGGASSQDSQGPSCAGTSSANLSCPSSDPQNREQAFRTEFNLIYTCSPLNANLGAHPERRPSQVEGGFSPADLHSSMSGPGLLGDMCSGSMSPYMEHHYGPAFNESSTPPHPSNPPQRKKKAPQHSLSLLTGQADFPPLGVRNMVSLLEYRKRKQGGSRDSELAGSSSSTDGAHPRPGSHYRNDSHHTHSHQRRQPPASPNTCVSTSNRSPSIPQTEEVGLPEHHASSLKPKLQDSSSQWMVPTTVERLREGQNLERVLRNFKIEQIYKRSGSSEREADAEWFEAHAAPVAPSRKSPHRFSPSGFSQQDGQQQSDSPLLLPTSRSPFHASYSPSSGHSFYPLLPSSHPGLSQDQPPSSSPTPTSSDLRQPAGGAHQQGSSHLKLSLPGSASGGASRGQGQQMEQGTPVPGAGQLTRSLKAGLQASSTPSAATHYPQRGAQQFQHSSLQGASVRTQSGGV
ncbi:SET domain-containing protein 5 isoform X2 [Oryzias latipes]|uniref:SET domain-containing protein 5 isoform X2 n=1 Tax=Oryzias latipes TaxID=8090 RepID=UPI000CE2565F|nr:SET domain-containing protein 5 isoform X2 [Oryzias latipes]